ncbi:hypothetical protein Syun_024703 [Stephania yunnanensis]|uniref:SBP-type domain-containing protein n=1 Tax=Stephania yunnanensis TaxID=152371 RepID=A0AAP0EXD0_9MAGN
MEWSSSNHEYYWDEWEKLMMPTANHHHHHPSSTSTQLPLYCSSSSSSSSSTTSAATSDLGNTSSLDSTTTTLPPPPTTTEPLLIGLKLGKRTYFEDVSAPDTTTTTTTTNIHHSGPKRSSNRPPSSHHHHHHHQSHPAPRCQVQGCNLDLSTSKDYHRRHRVCDPHSKSPKVLVAGLHRRFCQQCSRFHDLSEFDDKKRSCRRRLSDHNARRRKPHPDAHALQFNSPTTLPSSFYDNTQQLNVLLNSVPLTHPRPTWETSRIFMPGEAKASFLVSAKVGGTNGQLNLPSNSPNLVSALHRDPRRLLPIKGGTTEALNQGIEAPGARNLDSTTDLPRALSLLSNNSWVSGLQETASLDQLMQANQACIPQPMIQTTSTQSWPVTSSEFWQAEEQPAEPRVFSLTLQNNNDGSNQFQEFQLFKAPVDSACTWNRMT